MIINKQTPLSVTEPDEIPLVKIVDGIEYVSGKKRIAKIQVVKPDGRVMREGYFSRTRKDGYMFE